jgi:hypothetical protein
MFPDACGAALAEAVRNGSDPRAVVPDHYVILHGGTSPVPRPVIRFSAVTGPTLEAAAAAVPHGQVRMAQAGAIRASGGIVEWEPDWSRYWTLNEQHVHITEAGPSVFSELLANPVPRKRRIDGNRTP